VSPLVEKMMMKREVAMPPTRKEDAMKGVNSTYTTHALSWSRFMTCCSFYPGV